jgi:predicted nucleotidyltransferase component of viral defense system
MDLNIKRMLEAYPKSGSQKDSLREILQEAALLGLSRHQFFEHAVFYGGTALRILYGLDRYSEDLDFSLIKPNAQFDFAPFLEGMQKELEAMGFNLTITARERNQETGIWSAFLKTNTLELLLSINESTKIKGVHPDEKIQIKIEIDTDPPQAELIIENKLIKNPLPFYVGTYGLSDLFAGKMHVVLCRAWKKRIKGRDWYDLIWYLQKEVPLNLNYLQAKMLQTGHLKENQAWNKAVFFDFLRKKIDEIDWELAKADVAIFIPDKKILDIWSAKFFHDIVSYLKFK